MFVLFFSMPWQINSSSCVCVHSCAIVWMICLFSRYHHRLLIIVFVRNTSLFLSFRHFSDWHNKSEYKYLWHWLWRTAVCYCLSAMQWQQSTFFLWILFSFSTCGIFWMIIVAIQQTRLQIQGQKCDQQHKRLRYNGMIDAFIQIRRHEGVAALYSG